MVLYKTQIEEITVLLALEHLLLTNWFLTLPWERMTPKGSACKNTQHWLYQKVMESDVTHHLIWGGQAIRLQLMGCYSTFSFEKI